MSSYTAYQDERNHSPSILAAPGSVVRWSCIEARQLNVQNPHPSSRSLCLVSRSTSNFRCSASSSFAVVPEGIRKNLTHASTRCSCHEDHKIVGFIMSRKGEESISASTRSNFTCREVARLSVIVTGILSKHISTSNELAGVHSKYSSS